MGAGGGIVDGATDVAGDGPNGCAEGREVGRSLAEQLGEVAGTHSGGGDIDDFRIERSVFSRSLVIAEEEELVLEDRDAECAAEGVALERQDGSEAGALEAIVGAGVEERRTGKLECGAVNGIRARLDGVLDDGSACTAELGRRGGSIDAELLRAFEIGKELECVDEGFVVVDAVQNEVVGLRTEAVGGEGPAARGAVAKRFGIAVDSGGGVAIVAAGDAGGEQGEAGEVAAV